MPKYDFRPGDVVRLTGTSADYWFQSIGPFIVAAYPSEIPYWKGDEHITVEFVDIVTMDGKPPRYLGHCINACANARDCVVDVFLTQARRASGLGVPPCPVERNLKGWAVPDAA